MFSQVSVILFTGGVYPSMQQTPPARYPQLTSPCQTTPTIHPLADTLAGRHPLADTPSLSDTPWADTSPLLADTPSWQTPLSGQTPPLWADTPWTPSGQTPHPPPGQTPPSPRRPLQRTVRILLECILVKI